MKLIAQKPCSFGGRQFFIGDDVPEELVASPKTQEKLGVLAIYRGGAVAADNTQELTLETGKEIIPLSSGEYATQVSIPIQAENGTQALSAAPEAIVEALRIMQMDVKEAEKEIDSAMDENTLIILHACDSRKGIKNACEKRALTFRHPDDEEMQLNLEEPEESVGEE